MQNTSIDITLKEKSYFYNICYYSLFADLIIVFLNPFSEALKVFSSPIEYSFYGALFFCCTFKSAYLYVKKFKFSNLKKKGRFKVEAVSSKLFKKLFKLFMFLAVLGVIFAVGNESLEGENKVKILGVTFFILTSLWPLLSSVFKKGSKVNKNLFNNGIYFNLACFSARWISLSSAVLLPFFEYGTLMFFTSFVLAFYFMHTFLGVDEENTKI